MLCQFCRQRPGTRVLIVSDPVEGGELDRFLMCDTCLGPMQDMGNVRMSPIVVPVDPADPRLDVRRGLHASLM